MPVAKQDMLRKLCDCVNEGDLYTSLAFVKLPGKREPILGHDARVGRRIQLCFRSPRRNCDKIATALQDSYNGHLAIKKAVESQESSSCSIM